MVIIEKNQIPEVVSHQPLDKDTSGTVMLMEEKVDGLLWVNYQEIERKALIYKALISNKLGALERIRIKLDKAKDLVDSEENRRNIAIYESSISDILGEVEGIRLELETYIAETRAGKKIKLENHGIKVKTSYWDKALDQFAKWTSGNFLALYNMVFPPKKEEFELAKA